MLCRSLAAGYNLKVNIMSQIISWMGKTITEFTFQDFWGSVNQFFRTNHEDDLAALASESNLMQWCQQMSQYVLISKWSGLNEQDIVFMIDHVEWFVDGIKSIPTPSIYLLLLLSRLKEWQHRQKFFF